MCLRLLSLCDGVLPPQAVRNSKGREWDRNFAAAVLICTDHTECAGDSIAPAAHLRRQPAP